MRINDLRTRIKFQKAVTVTDAYDNRVSTWTDFFACWATELSSSGSETDGEASTRASESVSLTVRSCSETRAIQTQGFRILLGDQVYDIESIDRMANKGTALKFYATLHRRSQS